MADSLGRTIVCAAVLLVGSLACAQTFTWADGIDGDWDEDASWVEPGFPDAPTDIAIINAPANPLPYQVDLEDDTGDDAIELMELQLISADATLNGLGITTLTVNSQVTFTNATLIGIPMFESQGMLLFDSTVCDDLCDIFMMQTGPTVTWQNIGDIALNGGTTFTLDPLTMFDITNAQSLMIDDTSSLINNGSILKSSIGTTEFVRDGTLGVFQNVGTVEVTDGEFDTDAIDLTGDTLGEGTWIVRSTGLLTLAGPVITNDASVTLDGLTAAFPAFEDNISVNGPNGVIALEGGRMQETPSDFTNDGVVDVGPGSLFAVDLVDGIFTNFVGGMIVGGQLDLEGTFQFRDAAISMVDADVTLDGPASAIIDENGDDAFMALDTIGPGGDLKLTNGKDLMITEPLLMVDGNLQVGPEFGGDFSMLETVGDIDQPGGLTLLQNGTITHGGTYSLGTGAQLRGNGTVTGPIMSSGRIGPGLSPGELFVQPQLQIQAPAVVEIEIGGVIPVIEHDRIFVGGSLDFDGGLSGTLEVLLIDGFLPNPGDVFDVILANQVNGQFANVFTPNLPCELDIQVNYIMGKELDIVQLEVVDNCIGDCNDDGKLDVLDFICFQQEWNLQTLCGDCNGDGVYDILDFVCFHNEWKQGCN